MGALHRRRLSAATAFVAAALLSAGCGSSTPKAIDPVGGGTAIDVASFATGDPAHIDPALATDSKTEAVAGLVWEGLTRTAVTGEVRPAVATTVVPSANNTVWTFALRPDVNFSNGENVTPSSFARGWQRALTVARAAGLTSQLNVIAGADNSLSGVLVDDQARAMTVTLTRPTPDFAAMVSGPQFSPMPSGVSDSLSDNNSTQLETSVMIGNGPFVMSAPWARGDNVTLKRNPTYYAQAPLLDGLVFDVPKDAAAAAAAYNTSQADVAVVDATRFKSVASNNRSKLVTDPLLATEYWAFNDKDPTVGGSSNLLLRQAVAKTMDRKGMDIDLFLSQFTPATGWAPPTTPGYSVHLESGDRNVEAAKDMLRAWAKPLPVINLDFPNTTQATAEANTFKSNLKDIGIEANLRSYTPSAFTAAVANNQVQLSYGVWQAPYVSYDATLLPFLSNYSDGNISHYRNPAFDAQLNVARNAVEGDDQSLAFRKAEAIMLADQPVAPNQWLTSQLIRSARLQNLHVSPLGFIDYASAWIRP